STDSAGLSEIRLQTFKPMWDRIGLASQEINVSPRKEESEGGAPPNRSPKRDWEGEAPSEPLRNDERQFERSLALPSRRPAMILGHRPKSSPKAKKTELGGQFRG